jgi:hypothetical protein
MKPPERSGKANGDGRHGRMLDSTLNIATRL